MYRPSVITNVYNKPSVKQVAFTLDLTNTNPNSIVFEFKDNRVAIILTNTTIIITSPTDSITLNLDKRTIDNILVVTKDDYVELYFNLKSDEVCKVYVKCDTTKTSDVNLSYIFNTDHHLNDLNNTVTYYTETEYLSQLYTEINPFKSYAYVKIHSSKIINSEFMNGISSLPATLDRTILKHLFNTIIRTDLVMDLSIIIGKLCVGTDDVELINRLRSIYNNLFIDTVGYNLTGYSLFKCISETIQNIGDLAELLDYEIKEDTERAIKLTLF